MVGLMACCHCTSAQEIAIVSKLTDLQSRLTDKVTQRTAKLNDLLNRQTNKYLQKLQKQEARLQRKLQQFDPTAASQIFDAATATSYQSLSNKVDAPVPTGENGEYLSHVDSLKNSLSFLLQKQLPGSNTNETNLPLSNALRQVQQLQSNLQQSEQIKNFLLQRKQLIKQALDIYTTLPKDITACYTAFNKECYYYAQQVQEYKALFNDPGKLQRKLLTLLNKLPAFQDFMKQHSELARLFAVPGSYGNAVSLTGLQTRAQVQELLQNQLAAGGPNAMQIFQQNLQSTRAQINVLKDKINKLGGADAELDMPDFKPNNGKIKSFWKKLEYGSNIQSQKSNNFFPSTTDIGLSVGYKLNDKSVVGIGGSYKVGWGKDFRHIAISSQGVGFRSFLDVMIKGSFFASGGFEYNYQPIVYTQGLTQQELMAIEKWRQSGLLGVSKVISLKNKVFNKTKLQLLWDFLSQQQIPKNQPLKFRVGYNF
jgi:hypothetical protein